jgi:hypothetical protein
LRLKNEKSLKALLNRPGLIIFGPCTRVLVSNLSTARLAVMSAATLPFDDLDHIVAKYQVELAVKRHGNRHIGKNIPE